jgi:hypothetical protein
MPKQERYEVVRYNKRTGVAEEPPVFSTLNPVEAEQIVATRNAELTPAEREEMEFRRRSVPSYEFRIGS